MISHGALVVMILLIVICGIVVAYNITTSTIGADSAFSKQELANDKLWECIDNRDTYRYKPSHESCVRLCKQ